MPRVGAGPGAATQAAARKVAESDKPIGQIMAENDAKAAERSRQLMADNADEAQQQTKPTPAARRTSARKPAAAKPSPAKSTAIQDSLSKPPQDRPTEHRLTPLSEDEDFTVLVMYGPAGTRKTTSALRVTQTGDGMGRVLVIAAESGLKKQALQRNGVDVSRVVFWPPKGEVVTHDGLESLFFQILADTERDPSAWLAVVWDSLTEVIETLVDQATAADVARLTEIARVAKTQIEVRKVYEREGADYGVVTGQFRTLLRKWRTLPCHQIFVALEEDRKETVETDEGRKQKVGVIGPALPPKIRMDTEQHADIIIRTTVVDIPGVGPIGIGRSTPAEDLRAKERYGVLPGTMIDPGFERIWGYITGELKLETDDTQQAAMAQSVTAQGVETALESAKEKTARVASERAAKAAERKAAVPPPKQSAAQARRQSAKVTADSGTPDNPAM